MRDVAGHALGECIVTTKQITDWPQRRDELRDVEISHDREIDAEGILFLDGDTGDRRVHHDLAGCRVDLRDEFRDPFEAIRIIVDDENRGLGPGVATHVAQIPLDASRNLADETELASVRQQRHGEFTRVASRKMFEFEHAALGLTIQRLHSSEFFLRVDVNEFSFLNPTESVGLQNGIKRLLECHVEEIGGDNRRNVSACDDIPLPLKGEHLKHLPQICVLDLDVERVELVDFNSGQVQIAFSSVGSSVLVEFIGHDRYANQRQDA